MSRVECCFEVRKKTGEDEARQKLKDDLREFVRNSPSENIFFKIVDFVDVDEIVDLIDIIRASALGSTGFTVYFISDTADTARLKAYVLDVQRAYENSPYFSVTYNDDHACLHFANKTAFASSAAGEGKRKGKGEGKGESGAGAAGAGTAHEVDADEQHRKNIRTAWEHIRHLDKMLDPNETTTKTYHKIKSLNSGGRGQTTRAPIAQALEQVQQRAGVEIRAPQPPKPTLYRDVELLMDIRTYMEWMFYQNNEFTSLFHAIFGPKWNGNYTDVDIFLAAMENEEIADNVSHDYSTLIADFTRVSLEKEGDHPLKEVFLNVYSDQIGGIDGDKEEKPSRSDGNFKWFAYEDNREIPIDVYIYTRRLLRTLIIRYSNKLLETTSEKDVKQKEIDMIPLRKMILIYLGELSRHVVLVTPPGGVADATRYTRPSMSNTEPVDEFLQSTLATAYATFHEYPKVRMTEERFEDFLQAALYNYFTVELEKEDAKTSFGIYVNIQELGDYQDELAIFGNEVAKNNFMVNAFFRYVAGLEKGKLMKHWRRISDETMDRLVRRYAEGFIQSIKPNATPLNFVINEDHYVRDVNGLKGVIVPCFSWYGYYAERLQREVVQFKEVDAEVVSMMKNPLAFPWYVGDHVKEITFPSAYHNATIRYIQHVADAKLRYIVANRVALFGQGPPSFLDFTANNNYKIKMNKCAFRLYDNKTVNKGQYVVAITTFESTPATEKDFLSDRVKRVYGFMNMFDQTLTMTSKKNTKGEFQKFSVEQNKVVFHDAFMSPFAQTDLKEINGGIIVEMSWDIVIGDEPHRYTYERVTDYEKLSLEYLNSQSQLYGVSQVGISQRDKCIGVDMRESMDPRFAFLLNNLQKYTAFMVVYPTMFDRTYLSLCGFFVGLPYKYTHNAGGTETQMAQGYPALSCSMRIPKLRPIAKEYEKSIEAFYAVVVNKDVPLTGVDKDDRRALLGIVFPEVISEAGLVSFPPTLAPSLTMIGRKYAEYTPQELAKFQFALVASALT